MEKASLILGIDLGTTSIKVVLLNETDLSTEHFRSRDTCARISTHNASNPHAPVECVDEQDVHRILNTLHVLVSSFPRDVLCRVRRISVCGQMHGIVLWKAGANQGWTISEHGRYEPHKCSQLITWQDQRCTSEFLASLPSPRSNLRLGTGYGCATLFWFERHQSDWLTTWDCAGTIQDLVVAMLCDLMQPLMTPQNAASWGYFDLLSQDWNKDILSEAHFPMRLLPAIASCGSVAGHLSASWCGVPCGVEVLAALGDLQCSVKAVHRLPEEAVLNLSTSAQLAIPFLVDQNDDNQPPSLDKFSIVSCKEFSTALEIIPYFNKGEYLAVAAALTGGNVLATFVKLVQQWSHDLGSGLPEKDIWDKLAVLGQQAVDSDLVISPCIFGERHAPERRGLVSQISCHNFGLGEVYRSLCHGVINNLAEMFPLKALQALHVTGIVGSGSALVKNSILKSALEKYYAPLHLRYAEGAEAAVGAALMGAMSTE